MKVIPWLHVILLVAGVNAARAEPPDDYEKSLLNEAAETTLKGEKLRSNEVEPEVSPSQGTDTQALSENIIHSLEKALADKHDAAAIKQEIGSVVAGALGQGMQLDEIRAAVQTAMSGAQASESTSKLVDEVIEANRKLIEGPDGNAAAPASLPDEKKPAVSMVEGNGKISGEQRHTVKKDETLSLIALQYYKDGLKYWKIYQANQELLSNPDIILVGQELKIPE